MAARQLPPQQQQQEKNTEQARHDEHIDWNWGPSGGNPLAAIPSNTSSVRFTSFGGAFQPGLYKPSKFNFGNPVPLGLSGFALTTFVQSLINLGVKGITNPALVIGPALVYGGFMQILAGMWEMALGNVFGATALTSYGGYWISIGIILTPAFGIQSAYSGPDFYVAFGLYIFAWFAFTVMLWLLTLRSTVAFCSLFLFVWLAFLSLGIAFLDAANNASGMPNVHWQKASGVFGLIAGFLAWYNMLAGLADKSNSFLVVPVVHFPWSEKGRGGRTVKVKADYDLETS